MKQWYVSDENENSDVHVYVRPAACLPNRNQWYYAQAKVHYGSAELVCQVDWDRQTGELNFDIRVEKKERG